jgi:hypothetical protein
LVLLLTACAVPQADGAAGALARLDREDRTVSSMNYLQDAIDPACAQGAVLALDGFAARGPIGRRGGAREFTAIFNDDLPLRVIVRAQGDGAAEVSVLTRLRKDANPLARREAEYAVRAADEAIYRTCTKDGITHGGESVAIETEEKD